MNSNREAWQNEIAEADSDDLFNRITAYRAGMDPLAIELIEDELYNRGHTEEEIAQRERHCRETCIYDQRGIAQMCSECRQPAVAEKNDWYRLRFGLRHWRLATGIPLFPWTYRYCPDHLPEETEQAEAEA